MPIQRNKWWPFTKLSIKSAPKRAGIYELGDAKGEVVYIGSSRTSIQSRLVLHKQKSRFMHVKHFRFQKTSWNADPVELERKFCRLYKKAHKGKLPRLQERAPTESSIGFW